ncbi:MAG: Gfo/Idh/MocA family oxidoreductase [Chloroflexi bacterium]|nr:Gfo/Idh/MocA family oxidoreductase [Chloroflexota bacterium]
MDLVDVAVNVQSHYELAKAAVLAGKAVYCEWPLAETSGQAEELAALARSQGAVTAVGTQGRHAPGMPYLMELLGQGAVGRPLFFRMHQLMPRFAVRSDHWWSSQRGSGALGVAFCHGSDPLQFVLGGIASVCAESGTLHPNDHYADTGEPFRWTAEDKVAVRLQNGVSGVIHTSNIATHALRYALEAFGEEGQLQIQDPGHVSYSPGRLFRARRGKAELEEIFPSASSGCPTWTKGAPGTPWCTPCGKWPGPSAARQSTAPTLQTATAPTGRWPPCRNRLGPAGG